MPPTALRDSSRREVFSLMAASEPLRYAMNTHGSIGYAIMTYQSSEAAFRHREADKATLVRLEGRASRGHVAGKSAFSQRARAEC